ncbi:MAG TPA: hypothetical protein VF681_04845 [Abditibacteriaceae bacterium]|jgi:hypothetical protein
MKSEKIIDEGLLRAAAKTWGSKGGNARVAKMTMEQHKAHGKMMVNAREEKRKERRQQQDGAGNE